MLCDGDTASGQPETPDIVVKGAFRGIALITVPHAAQKPARLWIMLPDVIDRGELLR